jgi:hypothetical protein
MTKDDIMTGGLYMMWQMVTDKHHEVINMDKEIKDALKHFELKYGKPPTEIVCNPKYENIKVGKLNLTFYKPVLWNILMFGTIQEKK